MKKYKICVYAISKNEEKFVKRWYESMKEADEIYVLDTGSTDKTVELLKSLNVKVKSTIINPWRFDTARNLSLELVPKDCDICVCTDLDEVFTKGWRDKIEHSWKNNVTKLRYTYNWKLDEADNPVVSFLYEKIHSRNGYTWTHPVHEVLTYTGSNEQIYAVNESIVLNHYPDTSKSRSSYLQLLELSIKESPNDDRNMHYLGREYMYYGKYNKAINTLIKHLNLPSATWKDERCASMRFISRCYQNLNKIDEARIWLDKAVSEAPYLRDPWVERALLEYNQNEFENAKFYCLNALKIKNREKTYINEIFSWDHTIYDLLSICYFYEKDYKNALINIDKAIQLSPTNKRLIENKSIIEKTLKAL